MANDSSPSLFSNPLPLVAMALLAAGIVVRTIPLESARPGDADRAQPSIADTQDVPARLWQDPFAAVNAAKRTQGKEQLEANASLREPAALRKQIDRFKRRGDTPVQILGVMTSTSAFAEDAEARRRSRYAVVQGLSARGYTPFDPEALGYVDIEKAQERGLPAQVPFEWFVPENFGKSNEQPPILVLWLEENVLGWRPAPRIARLIQTICNSQEDKGSNEKIGVKSGKEKNGKNRGSEKGDIRKDGYALNGPMCEEDLLQKELSFIGPGTSYGLTMLVRHIDPDHWNDSRGPVQRDPEWPALDNYRFNFFSPFATNPSEELDKLFDKPPDKVDTKVPSALKTSAVETPDLRACIFPNDKGKAQIDCPIRIVRTIGGDDKLAELMSAELALRGVNGNLWECNDRVVIVAERDTSYGRELALQFRKELERAPACVDKAGEPTRRDLVWEVGYLRGLDGIIAETNPEKSDTKRRASNGSQKIDIDALDAPTALRERAEGRSQFDYVRRLAQQIRDHEQAEDFGSGPLDFARLEGAPKIKAIGVLGNDVYDKLLILQALQAVFPYAIFFTTDLDARLLHGDQSEWTRNLVVASNYGFSLRRSLQRATPPFRNGYQTSAYLATLLAVEGMTKELDEGALNGQLQKWRHPLVYELGRTREVPLVTPKKIETKVNDNANVSSSSKTADADCDPKKVLECERINVQSIPPAHSGGLALSTLAAGLVLLLMSSHHVLSKVQHHFSLAMTCVGVVALVLVLVVGRWLQPLVVNLEEPFFWFEGV
ncbi:MAG TPA: hypothetical protein VJM53_04020, partial [Burkholderiales bacterium]|nr:hypothetical protein [Burkholderiales bacterium]